MARRTVNWCGSESIGAVSAQRIDRHPIFSLPEIQRDIDVAELPTRGFMAGQLVSRYVEPLSLGVARIAS